MWVLLRQNRMSFLRARDSHGRWGLVLCAQAACVAAQCWLTDGQGRLSPAGSPLRHAERGRSYGPWAGVSRGHPIIGEIIGVG